MSSQALSTSGLRPPGLAETVQIRGCCPLNHPAKVDEAQEFDELLVAVERRIHTV